ncbi:MAG: glycosyltransferase family 25 protein [Desulfobacterales bacterium]|nr:glycosyltransferase family 25 protein [Desulfobacterales bacterium]
MKIFVINLKRSVDRKMHMMNQLSHLDIDYEFVEAVDGQELSNHEINTKYGIETFPPWPSFNVRNLSMGEIGCLLSHLQIYRKMINENIEYACIFEDDNDFKPDLKILLKNYLLANLFDWELLLLGHSGRYNDSNVGSECSSKRVHLFSHYHIAKPIEAPFQTFAYIIKKSAAIKLLQHAYPLRMPIDCLTGHSTAVGVQLYVLTPPCTTHNETLFKTTIYDRDQNSQLYLNKMSRIKRTLGEKYPILRILQKICLASYWIPILKLRKFSLLEDSYADKKLFLKKIK